MTKTDKKRDKALREQLTQMCVEAKECFAGFQWLTHQVDYGRFPSSFKVICVFDSKASLAEFKAAGQETQLKIMLADALSGLNDLSGLKLSSKQLDSVLQLDTEEACVSKGPGHKAKRLK
ncbi:Fis family transcriptional regulator [Shewanella marisflavi]|uniref:Fis family transcriptional regulator n=1 Tax=Shewanella marisflavi TaxID=260364 RepID=A0AAC9TZN8_9GAMM|nr:Fis family transcriptional regulator [Shewanella marisflavi]ASJ96838.1 Fis family transcriptional regulator [Shewanella marisflavi]